MTTNAINISIPYRYNGRNLIINDFNHSVKKQQQKSASKVGQPFF